MARSSKQISNKHNRKSFSGTISRPSVSSIGDCSNADASTSGHCEKEIRRDQNKRSFNCIDDHGSCEFDRDSEMINTNGNNRRLDGVDQYCGVEAMFGDVVVVEGSFHGGTDSVFALSARLTGQYNSRSGEKILIIQKYFVHNTSLCEFSS